MDGAAVPASPSPVPTEVVMSPADGPAAVPASPSPVSTVVVSSPAEALVDGLAAAPAASSDDTFRAVPRSWTAQAQRERRRQAAEKTGRVFRPCIGNRKSVEVITQAVAKAEGNIMAKVSSIDQTVGEGLASINQALTAQTAAMNQLLGNATRGPPRVGECPEIHKTAQGCIPA